MTYIYLIIHTIDCGSKQLPRGGLTKASDVGM